MLVLNFYTHAEVSVNRLLDESTSEIQSHRHGTRITKKVSSLPKPDVQRAGVLAVSA
jgi:hypothetical protein